MIHSEVCTGESEVAKPSVPRARVLPRVQSTSTLKLEGTVFLLILIASFIGSYMSHHSRGVATIWLSNGLLFAIVVRRSRALWPLLALLGFAADILSTILLGDNFSAAILASLANSLETFLAALLLTTIFGSPLRLSRPKPLYGFLGAGVLLSPGIAGALATLWYVATVHVPFWTTYRTWFLGDALGMAIVGPLAYTAQDPAFFSIFQRKNLAGTLFALTAPALVAFYVFTQNTEPLLFLISPALIFVVYRRGFPGAVMAICLVASISLPLTITGHGAMMLSTGGNLLHRIVILQIFLAVSMLTAFPIAALLEERTALEHSLKQREIQLFELANTDALTGQANRRAFDDRLEAEWQHAAANRSPLALLSIDVDLFKSFNDIYGHIAGDDCLRHIATLAAQSLPSNSTARLYRLGGEEFAVILPHPQTAEAATIAERIRQTVFSARIEHGGSPLGRQTVSVGIVTAVPTPGQQALSLLAQSDKALYAAKHKGRNRCELA